MMISAKNVAHLKRQTTIMTERAKSLIIKIQDGGSRYIYFLKMSISSGQTTGNYTARLFSAYM